MPPTEQPLSVTQITRRLQELVEPRFRDVFVEGEVTNWSRSRQAHIYFKLKDEFGAVLQVNWFKANQPVELSGGLDFRDGAKLRVRGPIQFYRPGGTYSLIAQAITPAGKGDLQARFEALKKQLRKEGVFDSARKRPWPVLPRRVGIIGSAESAAIRDVLSVLDRRFPNLHVIIAPVPVQGTGAAERIAAAIQLMNRSTTLDVLMVTRGGGSLEDLWAFNEEVVARAIAASRLPVICGIGHETDVTIAGWAADVRAPTPSAAAEMLVGRKEDFEAQLRTAARRLRGAAQATFHEERDHLRRFSHRLETASRRRVNETARRLDEAQHQLLDSLQRAVPKREQRLLAARQRLAHAVQQSGGKARLRIASAESKLGSILRQQVDSRRRRLDASQTALHNAAQRDLARARARLERVEAQLRALSPFQVLERGFSITRRSDGRVVKCAEDVTVGEEIETLLGEGRLRSKVTERADKVDKAD